MFDPRDNGMGTGQLTTVLRQLRRLAATSDVGQLSDAELLERFVQKRDEAAFELLVWRHGTMVLNLCRRILIHPSDADDAFQATFLALVRKASSIGKREALASWLYQVAYRVALRARGQVLKRNVRECDGVHWLPAPNKVGGEWSDLKPVLDEEVERLPQHYRVPVILCYLEGKTNAEAAELLGCPRGTIATRLSRARDLLRGRLTRRGITLTAGALAMLLVEHAAEAAVASTLVGTTVQAGLGYAAGKTLVAGTISANVVALTEGALHAMFLSKLKLAAVVVLTIGVLGTATGALTYQATAQSGEGAALTQKGQGAKPAREGPGQQEIEALRASLVQAEAELQQIEAQRQQALARKATVQAQMERLVQQLEKRDSKTVDLQRRMEDLTQQLQAERDRARQAEAQAREAEALARTALEQERALAVAERNMAQLAMEQTRLLQQKFEAIVKEVQDLQKQAPNVKMDGLLKELQDAIKALPKEKNLSQPPPKKGPTPGKELPLRQRLLQHIQKARLEYEAVAQATSKGGGTPVQTPVIDAVQDALKVLVALNQKPNKTAEEQAALKALAQHLGKIQGARAKWETAFQIVNDDRRAGNAVSQNERLLHQLNCDQAWADFSEAVETVLREPTQARGELPDRTPPDIAEQQAEKDFNVAEFYSRTGQLSASAFYFEVVCKRYPGSTWADKAAERMRQLRALEQNAGMPRDEGAAKSPADLILTLEASTDPQQSGKLGRFTLKDDRNEYKFTDPAKFLEILQQLKTHPQRDHITIRADNQLDYEYLILVMKQCKDAGFGRVQLEPASEIKRQPPPGDLRGQIKAVDKDGLVRISLGSDAGLAEGHTLEAFRTEPKPQYLGVIQIIKVSPHEAVGKLTTPRSKDPVQAGDQVASKILPAAP